MKNSLLRRLLSVILCVSILLGASFSRPQKAEAVAVSASVVAAVAAIMTACGVRYWAATSDYASDYLSDQIRSYLVLNAVPGEGIPTYEEWLGIDATSQLWEVTANGAMSFTGSIASKILDFVSWSFEHNNVHSNGPTVGLLAGPVPVLTTSLLQEGDGEPSFSLTSDSTFRASFEDIKLYTRNEFFTAALYIPGVYGATVTIDSVNEGNTERIDRYGYVTLGLSDSETAGGTAIYLKPGNSFHVASGVDHPYNYVVLSFNNPTKYTDAEDIRHSWGVTCSIEIEGGPGSLSYPDRVKVQPSTDVYVPDDVRPDQTAPYVVATNAGLTQGMTADQAADAIMDAVITTGLEAEAGDDAGDDAEPEGGVVAGWGWLSDTLDAIHDFIAGIAQTVLGIPQAISQAGQDVITGIVSGVQQVLIDVFVPDEAFVGEFVTSLYGTFDNRFSILSYPFSILGEFITRASGIGNPEPVLSWPNIIEPFSNRTIISSGSYNLNTIKSNSSFNNVYSLYMIIIKGYLSFEFLTFLYLWFCDVFHMRENDFVSPLDDYGGDDD